MYPTFSTNKVTKYWCISFLFKFLTKKMGKYYNWYSRIGMNKLSKKKKRKNLAIIVSRSVVNIYIYINIKMHPVNNISSYMTHEK